MQITFRPLPVWPYKPTARRPYSRFQTSYPVTLDLLEREVRLLGGKDMVMGVGLEERDLRLDGTPRASARAMSHPGVELSFDSKHGRLTYATDQYPDWQSNVRAIALSLEALRAVDRHGVAKGRQYTGFALLAAGPGLEEVGRQLVEDQAVPGTTWALRGDIIVCVRGPGGMQQAVTGTGVYEHRADVDGEQLRDTEAWRAWCRAQPEAVELTEATP